MIRLLRCGTIEDRVEHFLKNKGPEAWSAYLGVHIFIASTRMIRTLLRGMQVIFHDVAPLAKVQDCLDWGEVAVRVAELEARNALNVEDAHHCGVT